MAKQFQICFHLSLKKNNKGIRSEADGKQIKIEKKKKTMDGLTLHFEYIFALLFVEHSFSKYVISTPLNSAIVL